MDSTKFNYKDNIQTISSYFGISEDAARYIYHRRRRGFPYKKETDPYFLKWCVQLQNALIKADMLDNFNWTDLKFGEDVDVLLANGIKVDAQPTHIQINKIKQIHQMSRKKTSSNRINNRERFIEEKDADGWTVVTNNKTFLVKLHILRKIGLLPQTKPVHVMNKLVNQTSTESIAEKQSN
jgi:hypothetical protein